MVLHLIWPELQNFVPTPRMVPASGRFWQTTSFFVTRYRKEAMEAVRAETSQVFISPYDNPDVIAGQVIV